MALIEVLLLLTLVIYLLYKWSVQSYGVFEERGIPHKKPLPFVGNALDFLKNQSSLHKIMVNLHKEHKQDKIFGYYNFRSPVFVVNDPELVKKIGIKEFDSFTNHQSILNADNDPLFKGLLTVMKDQRWKNMRNTLTPVFTGAKMRSMFILMNECFEEAMKYLHSKDEPNKDTMELELKDCFYRLSNDLIATTAFGLKINSFENKENEFYTVGKLLTKARGTQALKFMLFSIAPQIAKALGIQILDKEKSNYFVRLVVEAMEYREKNNIKRPDMIDLLMEAKRESDQNWSNEEIVAQCLIFFFAAFENNATLLCTTCYELADNQEVQQKLYEEIMEIHDKLNGKTLDYDTLQDMKYLDMVLQESLRKWSIASMTDRECNKDCTVHDDDGKVICEIKKGDKLWFDIMGLHWDEDYFENPEVFDPERFSEENKQNIKPFTYIPFGVGPRICIGNRYALMQGKAMLYYLLKDYKVERSPKLCKNLLEDTRGFAISPKSGFWFKLTKRQLATEL